MQTILLQIVDFQIAQLTKVTISILGKTLRFISQAPCFQIRNQPRKMCGLTGRPIIIQDQVSFITIKKPDAMEAYILFW